MVRILRHGEWKTKAEIEHSQEPIVVDGVVFLLNDRLPTDEGAETWQPPYYECTIGNPPNSLVFEKDGSYTVLFRNPQDPSNRAMGHRAFKGPKAREEAFAFAAHWAKTMQKYA